MHNVQMQIADDTLLICVGLDRHSVWQGGTEILASTMGQVSPEGRPDLRVALVVYSKEPAR